MRILFYDIETAPNTSYIWGKYEQDSLGNLQDWYMLSFAAKWYGDNKVISYGLPDFRDYKKNPTNDKELVRKLWELIDEADVIVAHNGDDFDNKKANARFVYHGFTPPSPYKTIDTKKIAKRYFRFDSNKLTDIGKYLNLGQKVETGGFSLWVGCMSGDKNAWRKMIKYNRQDVVLLEKIYEVFKPWIRNHPNVNALSGRTNACPTCGSKHLQSRGYMVSKASPTKTQRFQCQSCGAWSHQKAEKVEITHRSY